MLTCPGCQIGLPDGTRRYPVCSRLLPLPRTAMLVAGVVLMALLVLALWGSGTLKSRLAWGGIRPVDTQPQPGVKTHVFYYCVLRYDGAGRWAIEDVQFERVEQGLGQARLP